MPDPDRKSKIDAILLKLPGVVGKKLNKLDAYFVNDRMFACISDEGVAIRVPAAMVPARQSPRAAAPPFQPGGLSARATPEGIQINRPDAADYEKDLELFKTSLD